MDRSPSSSPLRKKQRLSSPTYDLLFNELDNTELEALNKIELSQHSTLSSPPKPTHIKHQEREQQHKQWEVDDPLETAGCDNSGIVMFAHEAHKTVSTMRTSISKLSGFASATSLPEHAKEPIHITAAASFLPVSMMISAADLRTEIPRSPSPEEPLQASHDDWFEPASTPLPAAFGSASALLGLPASAFKSLSVPINARPAAGLLQRPGLSWALPSADALARAETKLKAWEAEIEGSLEEEAVIIPEKLPTAREPWKTVGDSLDTLTQSLVKHDKRTALPLPRLLKSPLISTSRINTPNPVTSRSDLPALPNPLLARSSAAADFLFSERPLSQAPPSTPVKSSPIIARQYFQIATADTALSKEPDAFQVLRSTPRKMIPLGLTPRARAFTGSSGRPKFVTPFKKGAKDENATPALQLKTSQLQPVYVDKGKSREVPPSSVFSAQRSAQGTDVFPTSPTRLTLANSGLLPQTYDNDELEIMGIDISLFNLTTLSHFLFYRFNPGNIANPSTQMSLGPDSALVKLLAMGCDLATQEWIDNHWPLILWKMIGMACLDPEKIAKKWSWDEVMRQLHTRYQRELAGTSRPALRLITTQDAPPSGPLVLCISNILWADEHFDDDGQLVLAHPELEVTDGWYRLRAEVDEPLARAARKQVLCTGRKIACSGARLDSSKKGPMEVLEAYDSVRLILSGNSTHLASWHTPLGFHYTPFVATLRSLTADGGGIPLMDLTITNIYPLAFIEFITLPSGEIVREGPRIEKDERVEEERWLAKRAREAAKLQEILEKKLIKLESFADHLDRIAGGGFNPSADDSIPDILDNLADEFEDSEDPASIINTVRKEHAGWLALLLRKKCETYRDHAAGDVDRELDTLFPPRQVRNFRVLCVKDARTARRASTRNAQLTVWDAMSMQDVDGGSGRSFRVGQRYLVSNLIPTQRSAWMGLEPDSEVYLSTKRNSKWRLV